jgi:hypothetical protein
VCQNAIQWLRQLGVERVADDLATKAATHRQVPYRLRDRLASRAARDDWGSFDCASRAS